MNKCHSSKSVQRNCYCTTCDPIISIHLKAQVKKRLEGITQLSTRIIHCESPHTYSAAISLIDQLNAEVTSLNKELEHRLEH